MSRRQLDSRFDELIMDRELVQERVEEINKKLDGLCKYLNVHMDYEIDLESVDIGILATPLPYKRYKIVVTTKEQFR